jgi:hypothetical protein
MDGGGDPAVKLTQSMCQSVYPGTVVKVLAMRTGTAFSPCDAQKPYSSLSIQ